MIACSYCNFGEITDRVLFDNGYTLGYTLSKETRLWA